MMPFLSMIPLLAAARIWYCVPLIIAISLVFGATRHENMGPILEHAVRFGAWIVMFMLVIFGVTATLSWLV